MASKEGEKKPKQTKLSDLFKKLGRPAVMTVTARGWMGSWVPWMRCPSCSSQPGKGGNKQGMHAKQQQRRQQQQPQQHSHDLIMISNQPSVMNCSVGVQACDQSRWSGIQYRLRQLFVNMGLP
jgi:hypothetical protein